MTEQFSPGLLPEMKISILNVVKRTVNGLVLLHFEIRDGYIHVSTGIMAIGNPLISNYCHFHLDKATDLKQASYTR